MTEPVKLAVSEEGEGDPPLLLAHGLYGQGRNLGAVAKGLGDRHRCLMVDLRNHGSSPWAEAMSYEAMAADLAAVIRERAGGRAAVLGHSLGGKTAMVLALTAPELVDSLIVVDIAPRANPDSTFAYVEAMRGLDLSQIAKRSEADAALADAVPDSFVRAFLLQNLERAEGGFRWRLNLDVLAGARDTLLDFPELDGARHEGPVTFIRGSDSDYVRLPEDEALIESFFPHARIVTIENAGHFVHTEQPEPFLNAVREALDHR